jgi:hypothetical protein
MMAQRLTEAEIEAIARRIVADLDGKPGAPATGAPPAPAAAGGPAAAEGMGIHATVNAAVEAARKAQPRFVALPLRAARR